jgi:hypothetical protein
MRTARFALCTAATIALSVAPVYAQGRGGGHANAPAPIATQHGNPHTATSTTTTTTPTTTTAATTTVNPIAQKIASHPQLAANLKPLIPSGMTLSQASAGFRNQGQFIAALHVSKNLNIPFADLKSTMLGTTTTKNGTTTTTPPTSLGQAIHKLRPRANSEIEVEHATTQTNTDLKTGSK